MSLLLRLLLLSLLPPFLVLPLTFPPYALTSPLLILTFPILAIALAFLDCLMARPTL